MLLTGSGADAEHFRQNVRRYNAAMGFASFNDSRGALGGSDGDGGGHSNSSGPPVNIMHGQAYHAISTLYPRGDKEPRYGQLYIYDPEEATQKRTRAFEGLDPGILRKLLEMLLKPVRLDGGRGSALPRNPYPQHFRQLHEQVCEEELRAESRGEAPRQHVLRLSCANVPDPRRYNKPSSREVAVVYVGSGPPPGNFVNIYPRRSNVVDGGREGSVQRLSYLSEHTDPLTYPLLHVAGTLGWSTTLERICVLR